MSLRLSCPRIRVFSALQVKLHFTNLCSLVTLGSGDRRSQAGDIRERVSGVLDGLISKVKPIRQ